MGGGLEPGPSPNALRIARARPEYAGPAYSATTKLRMWIVVAVTLDTS